MSRPRPDFAARRTGVGADIMARQTAGRPPGVERVLITTDTVGGVLSYTLTLADRLTRRGIQVAIAVIGQPAPPAVRAALSRVTRGHVFEENFRLEWMDDPWPDVDRAGAWLLDIAKAFDPDIVHLNQFSYGALPWRSPVLVCGHSCVLSWWKGVHGHQAPEDYEEYRRRVSAGLRCARLVVAPSRWMLDALSCEYGPFLDARVIYNGCSVAAFSPGCKVPSVLAAGRVWDDAKNVAALDRIAHLLPWPVRIAGARIGPDGREVKFTHAQSLGVLTEREMSAVLATTSVYAHPARYEPFGLSILEAGMAGCALVVGDIDSLRELWKDAATFVNPDDDKRLLFELNRLIEDPALLRERAGLARRRAKRLTAQRMMESYLDAYRQMVESRSPSTLRSSCA